MKVALVCIAAGGCAFGAGIGGGGSSSAEPAPQPGGLHVRVTGGLGWGTRYGTATALAEIQEIGGTFVYSGGAELAVFVLRKEIVDTEEHAYPRQVGGLSILGRSTYGAGSDDVRAAEFSIGFGFASWAPGHGPGSLGIYFTNHRVVDGEDRIGWSHGAALMFSAPLSAVIRYHKLRGGK